MYLLFVGIQPCKQFCNGPLSKKKKKTNLLQLSIFCPKANQGYKFSKAKLHPTTLHIKSTQ